MEDTATYECTVTNDAGEDRRTVDLTVQGRAGFMRGVKVTLTSFILPAFSSHLPFPFRVEIEKMSDNTGNLEALETWRFPFLCVIVVVLVPPSIADEPTDFLVTTHTPTIITCTASGVPFPSIHWTKNGIRLLPRGDGYRIQSSGKIEFPDRTLVDGGNYAWMASPGFFCTKIKE